MTPANKTTTTSIKLTPVEYLTKVFDGVFSEAELQNSRKRVFYRVANFESPTTKVRASAILNQDEIGEIINNLEDLQFNRRIAKRIAGIAPAF
jgi:hypothetical protein